MPTVTLELAYNIRNYSQRIHNFSILANVSKENYEKFSNGLTERTPKKSVNDPEWSFPPNQGVVGYFRKHNGFRDQELYNRMARGYVVRQGTAVKYYTTTFDPSNDPLFHEDGNRTIDRVFDVPVIMTFQPEIELYNKFGIQQLDETEIYLHMGLYLELNYQSLRRAAIEPKCGTEHNPIWSQRGYEAFRYYGYTFDQIGPKAGDKIKIEAFNTLYEVENVKDAAPQYQHRWRKYWWKLYIKNAHDLGQTVSEDVLQDPEQNGFINDMLGLQGGGILDQNGNPIKYPFDVSDAVDNLKGDVLFRPPEVAPDVQDISKDPNFYPGEQQFGNW